MTTQFDLLYRDILFHRCNLPRQLLGALGQIKSDPEGFAYQVMNERAYTAITIGEVAHIIKCQRITCKLRHLNAYYHELPVTCEGKEGFLKPSSHILVDLATPIDCNRFLPPYFDIQVDWRQFLPQPTRVNTPPTLTPHQNPTWRYEDDKKYHWSWNLEKLQEHLVFYAQRPATAEAVARGISNREAVIGAPGLSNLFDSDEVFNVLESIMSRIWSSFTKFGIAKQGDHNHHDIPGFPICFTYFAKRSCSSQSLWM